MVTSISINFTHPHADSTLARKHKNTRMHPRAEGGQILSEMQIFRWLARQMAQINGPRLTVPFLSPPRMLIYEVRSTKVSTELLTYGFGDQHGDKT